MVRKICCSTLLPICCMVELFQILTHLVGGWTSLLNMERHKDVDIFFRLSALPGKCFTWNTTRLVDFPGSYVSLHRHLLERSFFSGLCIRMFAICFQKFGTTL